MRNAEKMVGEMRILMKKLLSKKEQKDYLEGKIGEPVSFKYPKGEGRKVGELLDRVVVFDRENDLVVYWNMIDLISFKHEEQDWLRITYYRYKKIERRWIFAGQTSISGPISDFVELFVKAIREKEWIRPLFKEVCKQCAKELSVVSAEKL